MPPPASQRGASGSKTRARCLPKRPRASILRSNSIQCRSGTVSRAPHTPAILQEPAPIESTVHKRSVLNPKSIQKSIQHPLISSSVIQIQGAAVSRSDYIFGDFGPTPYHI